MRISLKIILLAAIFTIRIARAGDLPDAGHLLKESAPPSTFAPQPAPPEFQTPQNPVAAKTDGVKIKISGFRFTGNTIFSTEQLAALLANYGGNELTLAELDIAAATITNAYRKKGYFLASVVVPPQTMKQGDPVTLDISEGVLETIRIATTPATTRTRRSILESYARQLPENQPLNDGSLTSMVMRTNELPNISSRILLAPGSRSGTTAATLEVSEGKPYSFSLALDSYGDEATGKNHIALTMDLFSPLRVADQLTLRMQTSTTGDFKQLHAGYTIPLLPYGTIISATCTGITYQSGGLFKALQANGTANNLTLSVTQPLVRQRNLILNATVAGEARVLDDRVESTPSRTRRLNGSCQAGVSGMAMDTILGSEATTSLSLGVVGGRLSITDAESLALDQASTGLQTNGNYAKFSITAARTQRLYRALSLYAGSYAQWSKKNLNSSEQLSLSGQSAVRAWQASALSTDSGAVSTAELRYLFGAIEELPGTLELSVFVDHGYGALHANPLPDGGSNLCAITGAGVGVKWFENNNFSLQATAAWKIAGENAAREGALVYAQFVKKF